MRIGRSTLAVAVALGAACASVQKPGQVMVFPPVTIVAGPTDLELAKLNAGELFAKGKAAFASAEYRKAATYFSRGADYFPEDALHASLVYNAGLSLMQLQEWALASEKFHALADAAHGKDDALDAAFQEAACLYYLDDYAGAAALLEVLAPRRDIPETLQLQAQVDLGVCEVELSQLDKAEHNLREALRLYVADAAEQRMSEDVAGKAEFFIGEVYRIYFSAIVLDPSKVDQDQLGQDLEHKAEELLSAQGHYLRSIRIGSPHWATAAGYRIGSMYEELYVALVQAPMPPDLDAEQAALYREELKRRIRVLVTKAINIYDQTLSAATRIGEDNPFVVQTRESLGKMKTILLEEPTPTAASAGVADGGAQ
jgi:tetratricopeptide (TPR) repeat protein